MVTVLLVMAIVFGAVVICCSIVGSLVNRESGLIGAGAGALIGLLYGLWAAVVAGIVMVVLHFIGKAW